MPVKAALTLMGLLGSDVVRLPLLPLEDAPRAVLADLLRHLGLVEGGGGRIATTGAATLRDAVA